MPHDGVPSDTLLIGFSLQCMCNCKHIRSDPLQMTTVCSLHGLLSCRGMLTPPQVKGSTIILETDSLTAVLGAGFECLCQRLEHQHPHRVNDYRNHLIFFLWKGNSLIASPNTYLPPHHSVFCFIWPLQASSILRNIWLHRVQGGNVISSINFMVKSLSFLWAGKRWLTSEVTLSSPNLRPTLTWL